jgi:hypothetical protein
MVIREARVAAAQALRRHTRVLRVLVVLALLLGTAYAAELVATGPSASKRTTADALARTPAPGLGRDRATATSSQATRETHRSGVRIGATVALGAGALLLAWATRRNDARQSLVWRVLHGYVPRRGPPALRLT